jgi:tetratricopeptide (TPR) repeat protein
MNGHQSPLKAHAGAGWWTQHWRTPAVCLVLVAITFAVFGQTLTHEFVDFDDNVYVYENPVVAQGLTLKGLVWALTDDTVDHWHPLTWLSHMADCQVYGLRAGGHHLTNVALHAAAVVFLFLALREMTGSLWRSAFVAAVFAIHPLRAESVAWIAERKDMLGGVFFMLTLWAYARYARRPSRGRSAAVALLYCLGLLCKNTMVTLPFVLLLLDWWPLRRVKPDGTNGGRVGAAGLVALWGKLVKEKIPLFLISAGSCLVTVLAPQKVIDSAQIPLLERLGNAVVSYGIYLRQTVFPAGLATPYLYPPNGQPFWKVALAFVLLAAILVCVLACRKKRPYLLVGWLWFLGMLVPAIGIVQISFHAHADRFTYLPGIGLVMAGTWMAGDWGMGWKHRRAVLGSLMAAVTAALMFCAWKQTAYWQNSEVLSTHTLACATDNYVARTVLGNVLLRKGSVDKAIFQYQQALQINPDYARAHNNLGIALLQKGSVDGAISQYQQALQIQSDYTQAHENLGNALLQKGRVDEAIAHYQQALQIYPDYAEAHRNLGNAFLRKGRVDEAIAHFQRALQLEPADSRTKNNLAQVLAAASLRKGGKAVELARQANTLTGGENPIFLHTLAAVLAEAGQYPEAVETAQHALRLAGAQSNPALAAQLQLELKCYQAGKPFHIFEQAH